MVRQCLILSLALGLALAMDLGRSGVYDSPMAQDYYVRRFGFMFGGGQSGMYGLRALQAAADPMHLHSGRGEHHHVHHAPARLVKAKSMVELAPLVMDNHQERQPRKFQQFMAVA